MTDLPEDNRYDLVIEGTGVTESILAAATAWAGKRVLHVDPNAFYGSDWGSLSIDQLEAWAQDHSGTGTTVFKPCQYLESIPFRCTDLKYPGPSNLWTRARASRAYSLELSPHLLYCSSELITCLANTKISQYLEFKALEHIFILQKELQPEPTLQRVPSSRDDVFTSSLSLQEKRKLMKFLNFAMSIDSFGLLSLKELLT